MSIKTPGQIAYEQDVALLPTHHNGDAREPWAKLSAIVRESWERDPTPREWVVARAASLDIARANPDARYSDEQFACEYRSYRNTNARMLARVLKALSLHPHHNTAQDWARVRAIKAIQSERRKAARAG
jgi:hypothetical protein